MNRVFWVYIDDASGSSPIGRATACCIRRKGKKSDRCRSSTSLHIHIAYYRESRAYCITAALASPSHLIFASLSCGVLGRQGVCFCPCIRATTFVRYFLFGCRDSFSNVRLHLYLCTLAPSSRLEFNYLVDTALFAFKSSFSLLWQHVFSMLYGACCTAGLHRQLHTNNIHKR